MSAFAQVTFSWLRATVGATSNEAVAATVVKLLPDVLLVKMQRNFLPLSPATAVKLPTDGYKAATDVQRFLGGKTFEGTNGAQRPVPTQAPVVPAAPTVTGSAADPSSKNQKGKSAPVAPGCALN